jgi:hypothetical protein
MQLIGEVKQDLVLTSELCHQSRNNLKTVQNNLVYNILNTLQQQRRIVRLKIVSNTLKDIYNLIKKENNITKLLNEGNFIQSVIIFKQCLSCLAQSDLNKFTCLDDLRKRFLRSGELINLRIRETILLLCKLFDNIKFNNVINAMISLGDINLLVEYLKKYTNISIDECCCEALYTYVTDITELKKKTFTELCSLIDIELFGIAYLTVIVHLCNVLYSNYKMIEILNQMVDEMVRKYVEILY